MTGNEVLLKSLCDLLHEMKDYAEKIIVGGGFGLYLKRLFLEYTDKATLLSNLPPIRSTGDIDIFLRLELLIDVEGTMRLKNALAKLEYTPITKYFQFEKYVRSRDIDYRVRIDLLAPLPSQDMADKLKVKYPRLGNINVPGLHARITREAKFVEIEPERIKISTRMSYGSSFEEFVYIPNPLSYTILKLFAFEERKLDPLVDMGRHHAFDIFTIIAILTEEEWEDMKKMYRKYRNDKTVIKAREIIKENLSNIYQIGIIRLKENLNFDYNESVLRKFINNLKEIFECI